MTTDDDSRFWETLDDLQRALPNLANVNPGVFRVFYELGMERAEEKFIEEEKPVVATVDYCKPW